MTQYLTTTRSTCRTCRRLVPAQLLIEDNSVWMLKECPEHGRQKARVHGDADAYRKLGGFHRKATTPLAFATKAEGCPDSCGFCPEHEQHVCLPILEITDHCNWNCPICLVNNPGTHHWTREETARVLDGLIRSEGQVDVVNLSGGEPTLNPHFREIVEECVSRKEILRVSVSTNGSVLVRDRELLRFLAERRVIVSLQFDGLSDEIHQVLRGRPLTGEKLRLLDLCGELDAPMSLTATVARGVNDTRLAQIADLLFKHDHILSVMFQPASYAGSAARLGRPDQAVTIPDVIAAIDGAGGGVVSPGAFSPLPCSHPACFSLAFFLKIGAGQFVPVKNMVDSNRYLDLIQNRAIFGTDARSFGVINDAVYDLWSDPGRMLVDPARGLRSGPSDSGKPCACNPFATDKVLKAVRGMLDAAQPAGRFSPQKAMAVGERAVKSIFIHQFMDPETFDLSRARKCCQVYPQLDGRLLPVCVRNCRGPGKQRKPM